MDIEPNKPKLALYFTVIALFAVLAGGVYFSIIKTQTAPEVVKQVSPPKSAASLKPAQNKPFSASADETGTGTNKTSTQIETLVVELDKSQAEIDGIVREIDGVDFTLDNPLSL